ERELRAAGRAGRAGARQATQARVVRRARHCRDRGVASRVQSEHGGAVSNAAPESPIPNEVADFLEHLEKERNDSPNTVLAYGRDLRAFVAFLATYYGTREWTWEGVDRLAIRGFMGHLRRRGLAQARQAPARLPRSRTDRLAVSAGRDTRMERAVHRRAQSRHPRGVLLHGDAALRARGHRSARSRSCLPTSEGAREGPQGADHSVRRPCGARAAQL